MSISFRDWSRMVALGPAGIVILQGWREMERATRRVRAAVALDAMLTGTGIAQIDMGEGCTPLFRRIDPNDFYVHPKDTGDERQDQ